MIETYTSVGTDSSWVVVFMSVAPVFISCARYKRGQRFPIWPSILPVVYTLVCSLIGIPVEWIIAGGCVGVGVSCAFSKHEKATPALKIVLALSFVGAGFGWVWLGKATNFKVMLSDSKVTFTEFSRPGSVARSGLRISVIQHDGGLHIHPWGSWSSFSDRDQRSQLGPGFSGFEIYWGPHGLIRGDDLAVHFAHWAGVVPTVMTGMNPPYTEKPLPGFSLTN